MPSIGTISSESQRAPAVTTASPPQYPWIYQPWIDLLVGCGGWSAPLLLLGFYLANSYSHAWTAAFYFFALFFNYPHFMATVYRAYHSHSEFTKYRIFTVHVALLLALTGALAHIWLGLLPWIFTLYICWSPWHYTGQNFGLMMMFARRAGVAPTSVERRALHLSFIASFVLLMLSFHTGPSGDPLIFSLGLDAKITLPARAALAVFFTGASAWALVSLGRRSSFRALFPSITLVATQFLWFLLPAVIELASGHEIPQTRYSSGLLAVLHSTQYLWITSYYQRREARAAGKTDWRFSRYLLTLVAGGIALFVPGPWIVSRLFRADFDASFLTFTALVNIHHFLLDGTIWKLRDSRIASLLLDTRQKSAETAGPSQKGIAAAARWLTSRTAAARALRISAAALLFVWAGVDQLHFYWSTEANNLTALQRAAELNPSDGAVQSRLARAEETAGRRDVAMAVLQNAAAYNPHSLAVQESLARSLIEAGRDVEAYREYQGILEQWPRNVDAWVNYGLLAQRLGHADEAVDSWQRAVDIDPAQPSAQLYLADALDRRGESQAAARHYHAYIALLSAHPAEYRSERSSLLAAIIKVADADAAAHRSDEAADGYDAAAKFAKESGDHALQSLALVHLADLQEKQNDAGSAARSYQQALSLDSNLPDARGTASDWFNYAQFLRRQRQPESLVFACLLHAEDLLRGAPGEELSVIEQARASSEMRMGRGANSVRRNLDKLIADALAAHRYTSSQDK